MGSPPQVRGKHSFILVAVVTERITPAGAGKTPRRFAPLKSARDHPRRCGENPYVEGIVTCEAGSPPQVRGKLSTLINRVTGSRITPAGAGKTSSGSFF